MDYDRLGHERCQHPPALGDLALIEAADDNADEQTQAHLHLCPHCAQRAAHVRRIQSRLRKRLYRLFCPTSDLLVDYCQGLLDATQRAQIARHLADCPHCASEFSLLAESSAALMVGYGPDMWIPVRPVW